MPKRLENYAPIDVAFLPEAIQEKIDRVFNDYFGFGMKTQVQTIDEDNTPNFPNKVSILSSPQLGDIFAQATAWHSYASDRMKYLIVACNVIDTELDQALANATVQCALESMNVKEKEAKAKQDVVYVTMLEYKTRLHSTKDMLKRDLEKFDKNIASLSREMSRREHNAGF